MMQSVKKVIFFILGYFFIPIVMAMLTSFALEIKEGRSFWGIIFLIAYMLFPLIYRGNISKKFPNKYIFYGVIYIVLAVILGVLYFFV